MHSIGMLELTEYFEIRFSCGVQIIGVLNEVLTRRQYKENIYAA